MCENAVEKCLKLVYDFINENDEKELKYSFNANMKSIYLNIHYEFRKIANAKKPKHSFLSVTG